MRAVGMAARTAAHAPPRASRIADDGDFIPGGSARRRNGGDREAKRLSTKSPSRAKLRMPRRTSPRTSPPNSLPEAPPEGPVSNGGSLCLWRTPLSGSASQLARRLAREAEAVCRHYLSNGRREGCYWLVGDVAKRARTQPLRSPHRRRDRQRRRPGNGRMAAQANTATCSTSSERAVVSTIFTT